MLAKKYNFQESELKWEKYWADQAIYKFKIDDRPIYSIDTPPPTVSGNIHIGHIFSYTQKEMIARFKRLRGFNVFYPFGFDDNGLPSERLVEKEIGQKAHEIGREAFSKFCYETTDKYEADFKELFSRLGISTDWQLCYKTISPTTTKISQKSFLDLYNKGYAYHKESPTLWCNECLTSIAQAELETKSSEATLNYLNFKTKNNENFTIATTRPELIPAIVAIFVHPEDEKTKHLIDQTATVPLLDINVPIMADEKVDSTKGSGIVMCCTFGDQTDIEWWKKYNLPLKNIFTENGLINDTVPKYAGLKIKNAREQIIEDFKAAGYFLKSEPLQHEVGIHERCHRHIEYAVSSQWFINILDHKADFLKIGNEINWYPAYMQTRYNEWVENISWDWCISRQRYFGVPFPVWYCTDCHQIILANEADLPVNPLVDQPKKPCVCGSNNFRPETDVMDTWATSSVTPLINMKYGEADNYEAILKPMSLRANAHDIIRTWDFYTIVKSFYHFGLKPWDNVMISGFVMAGKGEKVSKSKNNSKNEPLTLINEYSADVVRYWTGTGRLGTDIIFNEEALLRGKKLVNKLWNVSKFIEMHLTDYQDKEFSDFEYFDQWVLQKFTETEKQIISYLDEYEVGLALNTLEKFFWHFCDNYIEIVKHRLYRPEEFGEKARYSGQKTIHTCLYKFLQFFSIYFPFITEEIYQELFKDGLSIHLTNIKELEYTFTKEVVNADTLINIISDIRGHKTNANVSLATPIKNLTLGVDENIKKELADALQDLKATLNIEKVELTKKISGYEVKNIELATINDKN